MRDNAFFENRPLFLHVLGDQAVGLEHVFVAIPLHLGDKFPFAIDGCIDLQFIGQPGQVVFLSMAGGRMNAPGPILQGDIIGQHQQ